MAEVVLNVDVDAAPETVWAALVDWDRQGEWMLATTVRVVSGGGEGVGAQIEAVSGRRPFALVDSMQFTSWEPPYACRVRHTGRLVRGAAAFEVARLPDGRSRFTWSEWLDLPFGRLGQLGFLIVRPLFVAGIRFSLNRFARWAPRRDPQR